MALSSTLTADAVVPRRLPRLYNSLMPILAVSGPASHSRHASIRQFANAFLFLAPTPLVILASIQLYVSVLGPPPSVALLFPLRLVPVHSSSSSLASSGSLMSLCSCACPESLPLLRLDPPSDDPRRLAPAAARMASWSTGPIQSS
eukprot:scaffold41676_cov63-Phaeocystis_antarctica.AAC.1